MEIEKPVLFFGDSAKILKTLPDQTVDLIVTSPPYADKRKHSYDSIKPDDYVEWFLPISKELFRVLKPDGSFILNIKENVERGERHTYVLELILEMKKQGWLWTEEYIWHKKNCFPGKWPNRFRDSWERCLHFTKNRKFRMYQSSVMLPIGDWADKRMKSLNEKDKQRTVSKSDSGLGRNLKNWIGKKKVYPTNVLHLPTVCHNKDHSAAYPEALPTWFIKLFTRKRGVVLDPFLGSGTTALAAIKLNRKFIGIEINKNYHRIALDNIKVATGIEEST